MRLPTPDLLPWLASAGRGSSLLEGAGRHLIRLDVQSLLSLARRRTGLHDFGEPPFLEPLGHLVASIEGEARLSFFGRVAAREDLVTMLMNRLRIERDRRRHPDIAAEEIRRPLFITGLPRSGSTFLHGLLGQDPANRVPLHWEVREPSPPPKWATHETDPRIKRAAHRLSWFLRLAPEFRKIHQVGARLPEECLIMLSHSFLSYQFSTSWFIPSYQAWLEQQDLSPAYRYHRRFLQHLQRHSPGERWLLKAPAHLPALSALFNAYPDANVIVTHRDPLHVVASTASLHAVLRRTFSRFVDPLRVGPEVTRMLAEDIRRGFEARANGCAPPEQFADVWYAEMLNNPLEVVRRVYRHFALPLSAEVMERMQRYVATNPKDKEGPHVYSLEEFGLDPEVEAERFRSYSERLGAATCLVTATRLVP